MFCLSRNMYISSNHWIYAARVTSVDRAVPDCCRSLICWRLSCLALLHYKSSTCFRFESLIIRVRMLLVRWQARIVAQESEGDCHDFCPLGPYFYRCLYRALLALACISWRMLARLYQTQKCCRLRREVQKAVQVEGTCCCCCLSKAAGAQWAQPFTSYIHCTVYPVHDSSKMRL